MTYHPECRCKVIWTQGKGHYDTVTNEWDAEALITLVSLEEHPECPRHFPAPDPPEYRKQIREGKLIPLDQHARAIENVMQLDMLRRSEEERFALKQSVRELRERVTWLSGP